MDKSNKWRIMVVEVKFYKFISSELDGDE